MKVAIVCRTEVIDEDKPFDVRYLVDGPYRKIAEDLNIVLIPIVSSNSVEEIESICDALIVPGCQANINPKYYNDVPIPGKIYDIDDYALDRDALKAFSKSNKPILGICGGIQSINVFFGGDLNQDISDHRLMDGTKHKVKIEQDSFLYNAYNQPEIEINSYHRQSVRKLAPGFKIVAKSDDGVVEAIEKDNIVAVQWHPELLYDMNLFKNFFEKCKKN